jgi:hypothetical protein
VQRATGKALDPEAHLSILETKISALTS